MSTLEINFLMIVRYISVHLIMIIITTGKVPSSRWSSV